MPQRTDLTTPYDERFEMLAQLVQKGHQLHDRAIFDFGVRLMSTTARLIKKAVGMGGKAYDNPITVKDCP